MIFLAKHDELVKINFRRKLMTRNVSRSPLGESSHGKCECTSCFASDLATEIRQFGEVAGRGWTASEVSHFF